VRRHHGRHTRTCQKRKEIKKKKKKQNLSSALDDDDDDDTGRDHPRNRVIDRSIDRASRTAKKGRERREKQR